MTYDWRITFPIEKAEQRADGFYLTGLASGPEIDTQGERMDKSLIHRFADQININGIPLTDRLPYRDAHSPDGVLRDLGWITRAWVTPESRLAVEVRLDEVNPAAMFLYRSALPVSEGGRGKQFGMSVAGKVINFKDEFLADIGKTVRTYLDVLLTEISNTTRPAWTPSFGSVLSKAIDDAAEAESLQERNLMSKTAEELAQETTTEASGETTEKADETAADAAATSTDSAAGDSTEKSGEESAEESTEKSEETTGSSDEDVEKAGRKVSTATANRLLGMYAEVGAALRDLGLIEADTDNNGTAEKADSDDEGETLSKSDEPTVADLLARVEELAKSNTELTAKVAELEQRPLTQVPPVIERAEAEVEDFSKSFANLDPAAKLRVAMAMATHGK